MKSITDIAPSLCGISISINPVCSDNKNNHSYMKEELWMDWSYNISLCKSKKLNVYPL